MRLPGDGLRRYFRRGYFGGDAPAIPDYTETPGDGYEPSEDNNWDYVAPGADSGADGSDGSDSAQPDMVVYE